METFRIETEITVFGVQADSFPQGVQQAWETLHKLLPAKEGRTFYGISHGTRQGGIIYSACVEEAFPGEANRFGCKAIMLSDGEYIGETILGFKNQEQKIGETFQEILGRNNYDEKGCCVEWYKSNNEVLCMVKKKDGVA